MEIIMKSFCVIGLGQFGQALAETLAAEAAAKAEKKTCPCKKAAEEAPIEEVPAEEEKQETTEE